MLIEISEEAIDALIVQELSERYYDLKATLDNAEAGHRTHMFSTVQDIEVKEIKKHMKAFKRVLGWYTVGGTFDG
jgi:hypothetical protein